jgi:hypothetical protein
MISRFLARLAIAWLAVLAALWIFAAASGGNPGGAAPIYFLLALPGGIALLLAWVFKPSSKRLP